MVETKIVEASRRGMHKASRIRRSLTQAAVAGSILVGVLGVAGAAWAGPMTGC
jgi:hypothetical protein